ncbi:hypothetical protein [Streptomyces sp. CNQ085]|uniref:hypothetical protein n=1 Tax=Streptomyces sp. CNQ085 TaxID=2886944 RepID=UPI001F512891|nr:hypothetical protein [Streptomyces sp. CNQ085]MCI0386206.1 hypothetical protein [Streptomyces sp. CNQ085]
MKPIGPPQLAPATALVQLIQENPSLTPATWTIDTEAGSLHGHLHDGGMEALSAYAALIGGEVALSRGWQLRGVVVRTHTLSAVWRDVTVRVAVVLPVSGVAGSAVAA